jgi:hypothetical protein
MSSDEEYESDEFIKNTSLKKKKSVAQKKRGRPKKNEIVAKPVALITPEQSEEEEEEIILQLPLSDDENESSSDKNGFTMKDDSPKKKNSNKIVESISEESNDSYKMTTKQLINELKKKDEMVKKMRDAMTNMRKNSYGNSDISGNAKSRIINMKLLNINKNNEVVVTDKTDIACWWCAHNFDSMPCFIPERFSEGKYYVFGCFCTYSCALAYNMNMNDYRVSGRVSLIKKMCTEIFGNANVKPAPPKELLIMFGGDMTIEDFRNQALLHKKEFKVKIPPLIPLLMSVEENQRN